MEQLTIAHDLPPEGEFPREWVVDNAKERLGYWLNLLSDAERADVFGYLGARYCLRCGNTDPRCPCEKGE